MKTAISAGIERLSLRQASPETIALTVVLGLLLGVCPVYGAPTLLCVAASMLFRPHVPLLHAINTLTSPLQIALLIPFRRLGVLLLPRIGIPAHTGGAGLAAAACGIVAQTVLGWAIVCGPIIILLSPILAGRKR